MDISPELVNTLWFLLILVGMGGVLTWYVAHWREFDEPPEGREVTDPGPQTSEADNEPATQWELTSR